MCVRFLSFSGVGSERFEDVGERRNSEEVLHAVDVHFMDLEGLPEEIQSLIGKRV